MTGSFQTFPVIYSTTLVASLNTRDCPTLLPTLTHDWPRIAEYSHTSLLGRGRQQLPTQYSFGILDEAHNVKGLRQQVCRLFSGINWEGLNGIFLDPLPEVMVLLIDVPCSRTHFGCLGQMNGPSIILKELAVDNMIGLGNIYPLLLHLLEEVQHDNCNTEAFG
jgi:hypothetical protein